MASSFIHDPQAVLDYRIDWSSWLQDGETISTSTWTVAAGITEASPAASHDSTSATIWLSGGTVGSNYALTNHITTSASRQDDRTITVQVRER